MSDLKLFDFQSLRDIGKFEIATDRAIGGNTVCSFGVKHTPTGVFGVFEGVLSNDDPLFRSRDRRTAVYATFRTKPHEALPDLGPFSALQFRVKTDGRPYLVMLTSRSADFEAQLDEWRALDGLDTWQCELAVPAGRWVTVTAPFDEFLRVDKGHVTILQHPLTDEERRFRGPDPSHLLSVRPLCRRRHQTRFGRFVGLTKVIVFAIFALLHDLPRLLADGCGTGGWGQRRFPFLHQKRHCSPVLQP